MNMISTYSIILSSSRDALIPRYLENTPESLKSSTRNVT